MRPCWLLPLVFSTGCGAALAKDFASMRDDLSRVEHDHDALRKRIGELEEREDLRAGDESSRLVRTTPPEAKVEHPIRVVKLTPEGDIRASETKEDDDGPRPMLRVGPKGAIEVPDDVGAPTRTKKSPTLESGAIGDYEAAMLHVKGKKWKPALEALAGFIVRYPEHPYAANAMYWRGECYFAMADYASALGQLEGLVSRFPASAKVPDALLKVGLAHKKLGAPDKMRAAFTRLRKEFPLTEAAKKIPSEDAP